ncbi:MAG: DUF882 domain-containing protein [Rhizobiaceae bacterium]|nr:DUF882 domain-containing protein [Rhizobiaceae bacterium]
MRNTRRMLIAGLIALTPLIPGQSLAGSANRHTVKLRQFERSYGYTLQRVSVKANCFPKRLNLVLAHIARKTGGRPVVTSGGRHGGRRGSQHRSCMAADIRVPGVPVSRIVAAARTAPGIGGIGTYCNGIVHVDVGPKRRWRYC